MLSPSSPSCWQSKRFWCSRLNDTSPAGAHNRLDVSIKQKSFRAASGGQLKVLGELGFSLAGGEVAALVGPSGCGKTTLLRIVAGLDRDFDGSVALPAHGTLGMVFQEPRLLPWRTVEQNVRLAAPQATDAGLDALFQTLGLAAHRDHYPGELSLGLARRARPRLRGRAGSASARRAVRVARRGAGGAAARRACRAREPPSRHHAAGDPRCRRGDRARRPAAAALGQSGARARGGAGGATARRAYGGRTRGHARGDRAAHQPGVSVDLTPAARRGGTCRVADRSRSPPAGRTARSSRRPPPRRPARTWRRARSGSAPLRG